jgi:hypothetical protein
MRSAISLSLSLLHVIVMLSLQEGGTTSPGFILLVFLAMMIFLAIASRSWLFPIIARIFFKARAAREKAEAERAERARLGLTVDLPTAKELELRRKKEAAAEKKRLAAVEAEKKRVWEEAQAVARKEQREREDMEKLIAEAEEAERLALEAEALEQERLVAEAAADEAAAHEQLLKEATAAEAAHEQLLREGSAAEIAAAARSSPSPNAADGSALVPSSPFLPPISPTPVAVAAVAAPPAPVRPIIHMRETVSRMMLDSLLMQRPMELQAPPPDEDDPVDDGRDPHENYSAKIPRMAGVVRAFKLPQIAAAARRAQPQESLEENELIRRHFQKTKLSSVKRVSILQSALASGSPRTAGPNPGDTDRSGRSARPPFMRPNTGMPTK